MNHGKRLDWIRGRSVSLPRRTSPRHHRSRFSSPALVSAALLAVLLVPAWTLPGRAQADAAGAGAAGADAAGAARLPVLQAPPGSVPAARDLLEGPWGALEGTILDLNRTPPLYEGDPSDDGFRPRATALALRAGGKLFLRLHWEDRTGEAPRPAAVFPDSGSAQIYKRHSEDIGGFADAACVMTPRRRGPRDAFPSLVMGQPDDPVDLFFWHQVRGFEILRAAGRGSTTPTGETFPGLARRTQDGWELSLELPDLPPGTPVAFAFWDGARDQRDGLKFFSIWYELSS